MRATLRVLARASIKLRYLVVTAWVAMAVAATVYLPSVSDVQSGALGALIAHDADAIDAEIRSYELFGFPLLSRTIVVQRDAEGLEPRAFERLTRNVVALDRGALPGLETIQFALPLANVFGEPPFSRERSTTALTYLFYPPDLGPRGRRGLAQLYGRQYLDEPGDAFRGVTGVAPARAEQMDRVEDALPLLELAMVVLVLLATTLHFRAVGAPLVTLAAVAIAYLVAIRVVAVVADALDLAAPAEVQPVVIALLFGIVTDYSIFYLSRFRGRLAGDEEPREAARSTAQELLPIILVAGLTVAAASATLLLARLGLFRSFGPGMALSVLVGLGVATTFVPAALAIFGKRLFWPAGPRLEGGTETRGQRLRDRFAAARRRLTSLPTRRPRLVLVATAIPLLALATGLFGLEVGNRTITTLPRDSEPQRALRQATQGFTAGILSPTVLMVEAPAVTSRRDELAAVQEAIGRRPGVAAVVGPGEAPLPLDLGAVFSRTGDAARYFVVLSTNPFGSRAIEIVRDLEDDLSSILERADLEGARASLAGDTAISAETVSRSSADLGRIVPAATLVVFLILAVFLRALVAPLYLVLTSLLALAASLGLTTYVFADLLGRGELTFYVPFAATVLLVALGSDYNVYLVGRIWNEARRRPLREAVAVAGTRARSAIAVAGLVLAASFAMIAIVPVRPFQELAFALTTGLLIDAFIVRSLLAPALITVVGRFSGWPGRALVVRLRGEAAGLQESRPRPPHERPTPARDASRPRRRRVRPALVVAAAAVLAAWRRARGRR